MWPPESQKCTVLICICHVHSHISGLFVITDPDWASYTLGIFVCLNCSGIHRNLPAVSRVKSIRLDRWEESLVEVLFLVFFLLFCVVLFYICTVYLAEVRIYFHTFLYLCSCVLFQTLNLFWKRRANLWAILFFHRGFNCFTTAVKTLPSFVCSSCEKGEILKPEPFMRNVSPHSFTDLNKTTAREWRLRWTEAIFSPFLMHFFCF